MKNILFTLLLVVFVFLAGCQPSLPTQAPGLPNSGGTALPETVSAAPPAEPTATSAAPLELEPAVITQEPAGSGRDALEEIVAALLAMNDQGSFRVEQVVDSPDGTEIQYVEVVLPDMYHMTGTDVEMTVIGGSAWVKVDGEWLGAPGDGELLVKSFTFMADEEDANRFREAATSAAFQGEDTLDGERVYVYTFGLFEDGRTSDQRLWVAVADGLPRRMEINLIGEGETARITNHFSDYNAELIISPPE